MAKRRKEKDEDEDKPFKLPKFDEEAFLKRERKNIKATVIAFLFGCLMAVICFAFWALMSSSGQSSLKWPLVFLLCISSAVFLRHIYLRINLDTSDFTKKNWFTSYAIYIFTWLIVLIILVNPPFWDDDIPKVELAVLPGIQEPGGNILFVAKVTDNVGVDKSDMVLEIVDPEGNSSIIAPAGFEWDNTIVKYVYNNSDDLRGEFKYTFTATDKNDKINNRKTGSFSYIQDAIRVTSSKRENLSSGDKIIIKTAEELNGKENFRVYYSLDGGEEINVNRYKAKEKDEYETSPEFEGWAANRNYTMKIYAEASHYFLNIPDEYSNIVEGTSEYNFTTQELDDLIGREDTLVEYNYTLAYLQKPQKENTLNYRLPYPHGVSAPGFEIIVFLAAIAAVVLIFKYKKKDRRN